jgi:hypothetical protein
MTFKGRETEINEQRIGHAVFGRSEDYDSSIDGIVRTQASRLRQRLELYFQQRGRRRVRPSRHPARWLRPDLRAAFLRLSQRRNRSATSPANDHRSATRPPSCGTPPPYPVAAVDALRSTARSRRIVLGIRERLPRSLPPSRSIPSGATCCSKSSPRSSSLQTQASCSSTTSPAKLSASTTTFRASTAHNLPVHGLPPRRHLSEWLSNLADRRYTSMVDLNAVDNLERLAQRYQGELQVRYARDVRPNDLKSGNTVLFGASEANPWVELYERNMNFVFHNDYR